MIVSVTTTVKSIAQMNARVNLFPSTYWEKSALVELSLEGRKLKIIILTAEVCVCYYTYLQYLVLVVMVERVSVHYI